MQRMRGLYDNLKRVSEQPLERTAHLRTAVDRETSIHVITEVIEWL